MRKIASKSRVLNLLPGSRLVVLGLEVAVGVIRWWGVAVVVVGDQIRGLCCGPPCVSGGGGLRSWSVVWTTRFRCVGPLFLTPCGWHYFSLSAELCVSFARCINYVAQYVAKSYV